MKFKKDGDNKRLLIIDKDGDTLEVKRFGKEKSLFAYINEQSGVRLTRTKALKLAFAIIDELDPI